MINLYYHSLLRHSYLEFYIYITLLYISEQYTIIKKQTLYIELSIKGCVLAYQCMILYLFSSVREFSHI